MSTLKTFWEENVRKNIKKISWIIGEAIVTIMTVLLFASRAKLDVVSTVMMLVFSMAPYVRMYIEIIFKGEVQEITAQLIEEQRLRLYEREIAEYRCILAARDGKVPEAVIANRDWYELNQQLTPKNHIQRATDVLTTQIPKTQEFQEADKEK